MKYEVRIEGHRANIDRVFAILEIEAGSEEDACSKAGEMAAVDAVSWKDFVDAVDRDSYRRIVVDDITIESELSEKDLWREKGKATCSMSAIPTADRSACASASEQELRKKLPRSPPSS
jgi:hypothetical protein